MTFIYIKIEDSSPIVVNPLSIFLLQADIDSTKIFAVVERLGNLFDAGFVLHPHEMSFRAAVAGVLVGFQIFRNQQAVSIEAGVNRTRAFTGCKRDKNNPELKW
ncbi:hypothetical protein AVEN_275604-1 [Araneus ventricosus]|uniref:Uncharacterized protein n=1 Tax=Araneus ventricosus TaxID=182803 RepID=A0A4Y2RJW8_ARAVE|nr:hypothetical protein AVEN_212281-1 [Araneus ventricosus]GBN76074.1 hypothetical protein AVEN_275604-1 [Araneus ventricosus]